MSDITQVPALPSTAGVQDPAVRTYLEQLSTAIEVRSGKNGETDSDRWITRGEFDSLAQQSVADALTTGVTGGASGIEGVGSGGSNGSGGVAGAIDNLVSSIKRSILYQLLGQNIEMTDVGALNNKISAALQNVNAAIIAESSARATSESAIATSISGVATKTDQAISAVTSEATSRTNKDNALASAINNVWAAIGGDQAVIQDGQLAQVSPSAAQATKWSQVQAAAIDPNTGQSNAALIRQDFTAYSNKTNGALNALYTVRAQVTRDGRTVVGGFGLAATSGAGSDGGPTIDFGVRADKFYIAATTDTPDLSTQLRADNSITFIVVTQTQTIGGITYYPGVYMKKACIADASIDSAKIAYASIDTLRLAGTAVTVPVYGSGVLFTDVSEGSWSQDIASAYVTISGLEPSEAVRTIAMATLQAYPNDGTTTNLLLGIFVNDVLNGQVAATFGSSGISMAITGSWLSGNGVFKVSIKASCSSFRASNYKAGNALVGGLISMTGKR